MKHCEAIRDHCRAAGGETWWHDATKTLFLVGAYVAHPEILAPGRKLRELVASASAGKAFPAAAGGDAEVPPPGAAGGVSLKSVGKKASTISKPVLAVAPAAERFYFPGEEKQRYPIPGQWAGLTSANAKLDKTYGRFWIRSLEFSSRGTIRVDVDTSRCRWNKWPKQTKIRWAELTRASDYFVGHVTGPLGGGSKTGRGSREVRLSFDDLSNKLFVRSSKHVGPSSGTELLSFRQAGSGPGAGGHVSVGSVIQTVFTEYRRVCCKTGRAVDAPEVIVGPRQDLSPAADFVAGGQGEAPLVLTGRHHGASDRSRLGASTVLLVANRLNGVEAHGSKGSTGGLLPLPVELWMIVLSMLAPFDFRGRPVAGSGVTLVSPHLASEVLARSWAPWGQFGPRQTPLNVFATLLGNRDHIYDCLPRDPAAHAAALAVFEASCN